jgi:hypothetical protein
MPMGPTAPADRTITTMIWGKPDGTTTITDIDLGHPGLDWVHFVISDEVPDDAIVLKIDIHANRRSTSTHEKPIMALLAAFRWLGDYNTRKERAVGLRFGCNTDMAHAILDALRFYNANS